MKLLKTSLLFGGLVALAASLSAESTVVDVNVPFAFVVGGKVMPAGSYKIEEPTNGGVLLIRNTESNSSALVIAVNGGPSNANRAAVTFNRQGASVVLSTISVPGGSNYSLVPPQDKTAAAVRVALPRK